MGTLIILTIICKLLGKDIKWAQRQLRRLWSAITRPFRGGDRAQNDTPRAMSRSVKIYLITALVSLTLLAAYVLFFVVGNRVINHRLESDFYGVACSELQMDLPEFVVVVKEGETKNLGVKVVPEEGAPAVKYTSSDESIVVVDADGNITGVAEGVGIGLSQLAQAIFMKATVSENTVTYSTTELSTFGELIVAFAGIGLALGLCRWVVNFVTSLGARNR